MTEIPDEIMAKARDALAADTKFRTKVSQLAAIFLRHDRELAIAAALLSESTASEAALKEMTAERDMLREHVANIHNRVRHTLSAEIEAATDKAFAEMSGIQVLARARNIAKTGGA